LLKPISKSYLFKKLDEAAQEFNHTDTKMKSFVKYPYLMIPSDDLKTLEQIEFEGISVCCPSNPREYMRHQYGDFMKSNEKIATNILGIYKDNNVASGIEYNYQVVAIGENGSISQSLFHTGSIEIKEAVISVGEQYWILDTEINRSFNKSYSGNSFHFAGRKKPVYQFQEFEDLIGNLQVSIYKQNDLDLFKNMADKKETMLYRDERNRKIFCIIDGYSVSDIIVMSDEWYQLSFNILEIDYNEVV